MAQIGIGDVAAPKRTGVAIDAFEIRDGVPGGYQFSVIGDPQGELLSLLGRIKEKTRRSLS
ncbi:MAG: hypothetical protein GY953_53245, partial [bacterium]|nr:hypothetical protein [bacterium]